MMRKHTYQPMDTAPLDMPICAVCGGVEMPVIWEGPPINAWCYWDEDDFGGVTIVKGDLTGWRKMF